MAADGSSRNNTFGLRTSNRANHDMMALAAGQVLAAFRNRCCRPHWMARDKRIKPGLMNRLQTSRSLACGRPRTMFSRMVPENRCGS